MAVGQKADMSDLGIDLQHNEVPFRAAKYRTPDPRVFATGDIVAGDQTVVYAVQKGKEVAEEVNQVLGGSSND